MSWRTYNIEDNFDGYVKGDCCFGTVTSRGGDKLYLDLDNGQQAIAYRFGNLQAGAEVYCTVQKNAGRNRRMEVTVDSNVGGIYMSM